MKWEKSKAAVRPFTYTYAMWTRKKPTPRLAIPGTSFSKLLAAEPLRVLMHTGPIKINFDPRLFSQVVKDRPVSTGLSPEDFMCQKHRDFQQLRGRENSLPIPAWLLGCQEVTWDMDRGEAHTESGRKYGEGGPWRGFPGPATQGH